MKQQKKDRGITLIALVVTIIVLIILASIALSTISSEKGIFSRVERANDKYSQSKAQEELTLAIAEAQIVKYEGRLSEADLDKKISEVGELLPKEDASSEKQQVIVNGYIFEIDRSVPKILGYIGTADGVVITVSISGNKEWLKPGDAVTVTGTIKTYSGGTITSSTATSNGKEIADFPTNGGEYIVNDITEDTEIVITAMDSNRKENTKTINVQIKRDTTGPTIESLNVTAIGLRITINATAEDEESGVKKLTYSITPKTGLDKPMGIFTSGQTVEVASTVEGEYIVTITAEDNLGNKTTQSSPVVQMVDGGEIKHIKTTTGLKTVNSKDIYGADVLGYVCSRTGIEWQLFYIDEEDNNRVYLIAKEYVTPPTTGTEMTKGSFSHTYYWNSTVLNKYSGMIPYTDFTKKFLGDYVGTSALGENLQATNYMLDQEMWKEYLNNVKADYAFGGPTLPLFIASYNDITRSANKIEYQRNGQGYQIRVPGGSWGNSITGLFVNTVTLKNIYFKGGSSNNPRGMWLASPSAAGSKFIMDAEYDKSVTCRSYKYSYEGFRPIVSLKSNVQFIDNSDGTYTIK